MSCKDNGICKFLKKFNGSTVTLRTMTGDVLEGQLVNVKSCLVILRVPIMVSPFLEEHLDYIRCDQIEHFSVPVSSFPIESS
jgi:hypothetical protein